MPYDIIIGRSEKDKKKYSDKGLIFLGKGYVTMGNYTSLSNKIWLDVIRSHVVLIAGKRGSGKSYSLGVICEELSALPEEVKDNIAPIIFDTMGIFWTMKYKNEKEEELLQEWGLKSKNVPLTVWIPQGYYHEFEKRGIAVDKKLALSVSELDIEDWLSIFDLNIINPIGILIQTIIKELKEKKQPFDLNTIIQKIQGSDVEETLKKQTTSLFYAADSWKIFASKEEKSTKISDLVNPGKTTVIDISVYPATSTFNVRALLISLISKKLFQQRMLARKKEEINSIHENLNNYFEKREMPMVWLFLDEAHEFLPKTGSTPATNALIQILREGRQPGISLVLATQQPGIIHQDVMTQSDIILSHRLTNKKDIEALNEMMQTYLIEGIKKSMNNLPHIKGSAIILDDNSERLYSIKVKPRFTWHGGEAPTAIKNKKDIFQK